VRTMTQAGFVSECCLNERWYQEPCTRSAVARYLRTTV
jgi:hypothetical protein